MTNQRSAGRLIGWQQRLIYTSIQVDFYNAVVNWGLAFGFRDVDFPIDQRMCSLCRMAVDTEEHLLFDCPYLDLIRLDFDINLSLVNAA